MQVLHQLPQVNDANVLVGTALPDDAGVYRLRPDLALAQSVDLFTPVVDDPYDYGQIAAANSLSDLYAMGARPIIALNVLGFPVSKIPLQVMVRILQGAADKAIEAGVVILGGHTIDDEEPKYGLAVTGVVHPEHIITNQGAQPGDFLVLTKPLGTGTITTALKGGKAAPEHVAEAVRVMATLNKGAMEAMLEVGVHACTDITGYGFLGHLHELLVASEVAADIYPQDVPIIEAAWSYAEQDIFPGGSRANRIYLVGNRYLHLPEGFPRPLEMLLCDAQTSGGLLMAVAPDKVDALIEALVKRQTPAAAVVGRVVEGTPGHIYLHPLP